MANQHILIVDDSPTDVQALTALLDQIGEFDISVATDGAEGVQKAAELVPDLILMDVVMPGMNGFRATREIVQADKTAHIPILIVTTKEQVSDNIWAIRQGASGFLNKPVDPDELKTLVLEALD
ncbi:response regulator [Thiohalophilus thiocyanatoxydans]|uniref:Twitching motility two-component system response regulator PilH n=1 Tax=Thiohalophilus thiocyanatoxydans TaxID=381308 RepID=A0A4V3H4M7_9GAMM|nr:response regulator [Thiohalophilus thiocyanatoxydans]TDY03725.1 twitching motility two-component system response regulator PilH [Thiohalophilus thiocyanatoxydans]